MRARVKTSAMGPHLKDKVFRVVGTQKVDGFTLYDLDVTSRPRGINGAMTDGERRVYPFGANEVTILERTV